MGLGGNTVFTFGCMLILILFLAGIMLFNAKVKQDACHFFDKKNSVALRGFWSIIVVLVHVPFVYRNQIQDMLGSFAYIGVTFFFMTSAYGLKYNMGNDVLNGFWKKRLPKLLVPMFFVNVFKIVVLIIKEEKISLLDFLSINGWIWWLLICYFVFWSVHKLSFINIKRKDVYVCIIIIFSSLFVYLIPNKNFTTWCPEVYGFVFGIMLFHFKEKFISIVNNPWLIKCIFFCMLSGATGLLYLKFKYVIFFGDYVLKVFLGLLIICFMLSINRKIDMGNKVSLFLGQISYEIYLLHGCVFGLVAYLFPELESGIYICLCIVITIIVAYIVNIIARFVINSSRHMLRFKT